MKKIFGNRLKNLRKQNDEMQSDLAEVLQVNTSMISLWENGKNYPEVKKLIEIAEHYNVTTDYLLGLEKDSHTNSYNYGVQYNHSTHNGNNTFNGK